MCREVGVEGNLMIRVARLDLKGWGDMVGTTVDGCTDIIFGVESQREKKGLHCIIY